MLTNEAPSWIDNFSLLAASGGGFGLDLGFVLGSMLGSRAPSAILAKLSTAPRREHDFRGSGGVKKEAKLAPETASSGNLAPRAAWEPLGLDFGPFWGPF